MPKQGRGGSKFGVASFRVSDEKKARLTTKSKTDTVPQHSDSADASQVTNLSTVVSVFKNPLNSECRQKLQGRSRNSRQRRRNKFTDEQPVTANQSKCSASSTSQDRHSAKYSSSASTADELDIPGFYYDKEKKRYFKIAPNHSSVSVTNDALAKKAAEIKRQNDLQTTFSVNRTSETVTNRHAPKCSRSVTELVRNQSIGCLHSEQLLSKVVRNAVSNLKPSSSQHLFDQQTLERYDNIEHMHMMHTSPSHSDLLCLWSLKDTWVQRIQMVKLAEKSRRSRGHGLSLCAEPHEKVIIQSLNKVTDMCWAPITGSADKKTILYTTICHTGYLYSLAMVRSLTADRDGEEATFLDYNLGKKATWSCAWNPQRYEFSVGSERCAMMLHVERRTMREYYTNNSDPLSQTFSKQTGNCLITGTRKGHILLHDMRGRSTRPVAMMPHKSSVCGLQLLTNDVSLVAADYTGKVCLWDIRKHNIVIEYTGNQNQYSRIPVHVDEYEKIVYTVGEDGYTRFWDLRLGTLLHTIPPPCLVTRETVPVVHFSMSWGNQPANPALLMGLENKLHYYRHVSMI